MYTRPISIPNFKVKAAYLERIQINFHDYEYEPICGHGYVCRKTKYEIVELNRVQLFRIINFLTLASSVCVVDGLSLELPTTSSCNIEGPLVGYNLFVCYIV